MNQQNKRILIAGGEALSTLGLSPKLGLGGKVADGTQGMSWIPKRLMEEGFEFRFAAFEPALRDLYARKN